MGKYELDNITNSIIDKISFLITTTGDITPVISGIANAVRLKRFKKRIDKHEKQIKSIYRSIDMKDYEFFAEKIGTMVFEKIMNDHEEDKAEFLILGFENCVNNDIKDDDLVIFYFDMLSELRVLDLKRLVSISKRTSERPLIPIQDSDQQMLIQSSDMKLKRLGLIGTETSWSSVGGESINYSKPLTISVKGGCFLDFLGI